MSPANSSGLKSADAVISALPARLLGIQLFADGTNQATITVYDNATAASGTVLAQVIVDAGLVAQDAQLPNPGIIANNGLYADVSGTGATYIIHWSIS